MAWRRQATPEPIPARGDRHADGPASTFARHLEASAQEGQEAFAGSAGASLHASASALGAFANSSW
eukprot:1293036-Lingulodinium_polyedra.AAC.2